MKTPKITYQSFFSPVKPSKKRRLFAAITVIVVGLLLFANVAAFGLIALPEFSMYAAVAGAVVLTIITVGIALNDKRRGSIQKTNDTPMIGATKESMEAPVSIIQPGNLQKRTNTLEAYMAKQKNQPVRQVTAQTIKLICPNCRKEFNLSTFDDDLMVDFGPPKQSNLIKPCPHCEAPVSLKRKGAVEDIWKE